MRIATSVRRFLHAMRCRVRGVDEHALIPIQRRTDLKRLGGACGWVVPLSLLRRGAVCYCVGAGEDISFDLAVARELGCDVHTFDPTPRAILHVDSLRPDLPRNLTFHPWGVWARDEEMRFYAPKNPRHVSHSIVNLQSTTQYFDAECKRLRTIMAELGHRALVLLKLDIEGAEYQVIESLIADGVRPAAVAVEFDEIHSPQNAGAEFRIVEAIKQLIGVGYDLVAVDGSNYTFVAGGRDRNPESASGAHAQTFCDPQHR